LSFLLWLLAVVPALGATLPRTVSWSELAAAGKLEAGKVVRDGDRDVLEIENAGAAKTIRLAVIDDPGITTTVWSLRGEVRYEGVEGRGYLELLNTLGSDSVYFTRSMAERGPMQYLEGSHGWRPFVLPFYSQPGAPKPTRLTFSVKLPGRGKVWLSNPILNQHTMGQNPLATGDGWWSERAAGWVGALLGIALGSLGALVGVLAGLGRGRRVALGIMLAGVVAGISLMGAGFIAVFSGQPWHVYYPMLLAGAIGTVVLGALVRSVRRRFRAVELRKMSAMDS
jgi:hypothetical protein